MAKHKQQRREAMVRETAVPFGVDAEQRAVIDGGRPVYSHPSRARCPHCGDVATSAVKTEKGGAVKVWRCDTRIHAFCGRGRLFRTPGQII